MGWGIPTLSIKHMNKVEIQVERVEIKSHPRKLKGDWKIEIDPEPLVMYYYPPLWERIWNRILNLFGKRKNQFHKELTKEFKK
jgi:hypothetical protein